MISAVFAITTLEEMTSW